MSNLWQKTGVVAPGGTVSTIAGGEQLWLGSGAGIFAHTAGGDWQPIEAGQPLLHVSALAASGGVLFAGSGQGQIVYSNNGGQSWYRGENSLADYPISWILPAPNFQQSGVVLAGTGGGGILRSENSGRSWQPANFGLQDFSVMALACPPVWGRRELVFAATAHGLYRSPNGGRAWKKFGRGLDNVLLQSLAVSPNFDNDRTLLAGTESSGILYSADGGKQWQPCNTGLQSLDGSDALPPINALWLHPDFGQNGVAVAATGDGQLLRSADGGQSWQRVHQPGAAILCLHGNSDTVFAGLHRQGLLRSADGGQSWAADSQLAAHNLTRLQPGSNGALLAFGMSGQVWRSADGGRHWSLLAAPAGENPLPVVLEIGAGESPASLLAATNNGLLRSTDEGQTWDAVVPEPHVLALHACSHNGDGTILAGTTRGTLLLSADGGQSWAEQPLPQPDSMPILLHDGPFGWAAAIFSPKNGQLTLWRSGDRGQSWQQWQQASVGWPSAHMQSLGGDTIVCFENRCWRSSGAGWEKVLQTERPVVRLARLAGSAGLLLLTENQLLHSTTGARWADFSDGLPERGYQDVAVTPNPDGGQVVTVLVTGGQIWQRNM